MQMCEMCGKKASMGNQVETRGKAKYLGGVGTKVTGISRRKFKPNLQSVKISTTNGTVKKIRVCTSCHGFDALRRVLYFHDPSRRSGPMR